ncbi:hypothetical protein SAMN05216357_1356 [Porphyromonadaceae bacterium KH3CP3RA]|nr:hypothetical protein SAMN05216357_1356 [Porphyromonadaceae bacterium KH3CP3RA]
MNYKKINEATEMLMRKLISTKGSEREEIEKKYLYLRDQIKMIEDCERNINQLISEI